ncbi:MAG: protoporphyrinogen oxidase [Holophagaceae bacterium]|nr:protoporphyrinogen oxidase [Holophagaceae bacterium]
MTTLILGGGVSGLVTAWHLQKRGEAVEVWEAQETIGGWVRTLPWPDADGRPGHVERGPQGVLVAPGSAADRLFKELELEVRSPGHGARWVGMGGSLIPVPAAPVALLFSRLMSVTAKLRMMMEPFVPVRSLEPEENLSAFVARRLGRGVAENLLPAMVAGVLAAPAESLSVEALPKLLQWEAKGSLFKGMRSGGSSSLMVPKGGMGMLPKRLAERLSGVRTGLRAEGLERLESGRWRVWGAGELREADRVLLALPAYEASVLLGPIAPQSAEALAAIPYTSVRLRHSRHARLAPLDDSFGFLVHPPEGHGFLGALVPSWIDPDSAPPDLMQLRAFLGGAFEMDPSLSESGGVQKVLRSWVPRLGEPLQVREELADRAIPRPEMGHRSRVKAALAGLPAGIDWISNARFGPGVRDVVEGVEAWVERKEEN